MRPTLRFLLRVAALLMAAAAVFIIFWQPKETVASADLLTKVNVGVECSSVWSQWTHHAHPAALTINGSSLANLQAAQNSCASASHTIKEVAAGLGGGAVVFLGATFIFRRIDRV